MAFQHAVSRTPKTANNEVVRNFISSFFLERPSRCVLSNLYMLMHRQYTTYVKQDAIITIR
jgi:hypothetical protein